MKSGEIHELLFLYVVIYVAVLTEKCQSQGKMVLTLQRDNIDSHDSCLFVKTTHARMHTHTYTCYFITISKHYSHNVTVLTCFDASRNNTRDITLGVSMVLMLLALHKNLEASAFLH